MATVQEAEQIVRRLAKKYGLRNEKMMDDIEQFNAEYRQELDETWLAMENELSHSVKVLAKQIYSSGARFVFELLQNAEDNIFEKAREAEALPFVSFKIYPNKIIVECNEDGFKEPHLQAICAVGRSTKSASHGYIGAKGIGFKSVFIAASRVHIQSGNFSFEFRHRRTDPGLGMIRPIWVSPVEAITSPLTRTTLYIHDQGDPDELQHLKRIISMQFDDLQETCLLFLRKLEQISLEFYNENGELERSKYFRKHKIDDYRVSLETTSGARGDETTQSQIYHITRQIATNLARSDNRELPDTKEAKNDSSKAEVVLAFPMTGSSEPLITQKNQDLFAFLPLRRSDYKFLIHSDFDTNANRQDIITTSRRNLELRDCIASAFLQAILQFCEHPTLCYSWPMFLPSSSATSSDAFWSGLNHEIQRLMKKTPVLKSRNRIDLRLVGDVVILTGDAQDAEGHPLFDDPTKDLYLSSSYSQMAKDILKGYGLEKLNIQTFLNLLETDLRSPNSRFHGENTTDDWHSAIARLLSGKLKNSLYVQQRLKSLPLLPLRSGAWTSTTSGPVYFPKTGDINIPQSLDLKVITAHASSNSDRSTLFQHLGVCQATYEDVRASILRSFQTKKSMSFEVINEYLSFLYLTHQIGKHGLKEYTKVHVGTSAWKRDNPHETDIYLPGTEHAYSPESLLANEGASPDLSVVFLHSKHMESAPDKPNPFHPSWETWLCDLIGVRKRLRLISRDKRGLSDVFLYIFEHRPEKFLGLFEHLWLHEKSSLVTNRALRSKIEDLPAQKLCDVNYSLTLKQAWLPLKYLRHSVDRYMEYPKQFPFLKLEESDITVGSKWHFLSDYFSVSKDDSMDFLLQMLQYIQLSCPKQPSNSQTQKVFDLYVAIYARLTVTSDGPDARLKITQFFDKGGVLDPNQNDPMWTTSRLCLWTAPPDMVMFHSLRSSYMERVDNEKFRNIESLFKGTLQIPDASLANLVTELTKLREEGCEEIPRMRTIYDYLHKTKIPLPSLKAAFEASPLIYCETRHGESGWYKTSDCLWSSETVIRGKAVLDECWEAYENFFVGKLGVKLLTLQMVYDELRQSSGKNTEETKVAVLSLNGLLQTEMTRLDPEPIRQAKVFPIRYPTGTVVLSSVSVDFAIGDRDKLKMMFRDKVALLDFEMDEVRRLRPLIEWLRLQDRYLSNSVEESTFICSDSERPISTPNRDLKRKAYHIARPRFEDNPLGLYAQLRTMRVVEVEKISSVLRIFQNKQSFEISVATANEHIEDSTGNLTIYVPKERRAQELCFGSVLPRKFAAWLMRSPKRSTDVPVETDIVKVLTAVFASERFVLDDVLDDQGILTVSFDNEDEEDNSKEAEEHQVEDQEEESQEQRLSDSRLETDDTSPEQLTPDRSSINAATPPYTGSSGTSPEGNLQETLVEETISQRSHMSYQPHSGRVHRSSQSDLSPSSPQPLHHTTDHAPSNPISVMTSPSEQQSSEDARYRSILDRVIEKARNAAFPSRGSFDMTHMRNALPGGDTDAYQSFDGLDVMGQFRSTNQLERDKKVGAAGELYVFELLSCLDLPNWNRSNWQSTIRSYVTIHPDYTDLQAWRGRETADLVYVDAEGHLTNTLIGCGYLGHDEWHGARPKYYIEVKTTTGPCSTAFYMSGKQYQLMQQVHHTEDHSEIYIVFRVFQLNSDGVGLCVYTDPEKLRQDGGLLFKGQAWSITPGPNMG
ncbi:ATPase-like ATP-binding domain-containing protein [Fusarium mexicanum]|uniref:ATPase-like ATP-binding domain-containing protein n=1 Tax=Fusarium mexicanum TaxID=751941 RepID=A0A8H5MR64_9HYPO|nr:ATPase-like ATP-binding domain-containing protein [Fusarium mexicanum]